MENLLATIHVAIVEDERRTREGLRDLIEGSEGFLCMGAWGSMEDALASEWTTPLNVILLDLGLPGMSGIEGIPLLRKRCPGTALVVLTVYDDNERDFPALCAGAPGHLAKNTPPRKLREV